MPLFSRFKNKGAHPASKGKHQGDGNGSLNSTRPARWQSRWESAAIVPDEVMELVNVCTAEMKSRAEALDAPFLLLPFRPETDPTGARTFIRNFYKSNLERSSQYTGEGLRQELRLTDSVVLCNILKWCWSRVPGGVVSWAVYEAFRIGEMEAQLARNAFNTFIPLGVDSDARRSIIFDFFDLLAAVAAHGKMNGLTGRKLSRLAGWWAFDHSDSGNGFEGGYKSWTAAADATSHLFFAYLRSQSPDTDPSMNVIERIPRSLQALVASTEYPPETPILLQKTTPRVVMLVDTVSPTPFSLLRRAKNFEYRDQDRVLREFQEFEDPIDALTDECKRVLLAVSSANQSSIARSRHGLAKTDESWTAFSSMGFADIDEKSLKSPNTFNEPPKTVEQSLRDTPASRSADFGRPTTPSWADFLSSGFADDGSAKSPTLLYPPAHVLPPIGSGNSSSGPLPGEDENLAPGELAAVTTVELDDAFWWVWMTSLAGEESANRKGVFGRCALIETNIMNGRWLIMEEQVKGASPDPAEGVYIASKKGFFSTLTKRGRLGRKRSTSKGTMHDHPQRALSATPSKTSITTDQQAKIKAAARALTRKQGTPETDFNKRSGNDDGLTGKNNNLLASGLQSEAGPAMQWAKSYDKNAIRTEYLGDSLAGKGAPRNELAPNASPSANGVANTASPRQADSFGRALPAVPKEQPASGILEPAADITDSNIKGLSRQETPKSPKRQAEPKSALEKELGGSAGVSPQSISKIERKPLSRPEGHPAFRSQNKEDRRGSASPPTQNAAAMAAARAMQSRLSSSPESPRVNDIVTKKPVGTSAGIKKLFGKKKDDNSRGDSFDLPRPNGNGLNPPVENSISRRLSLMRRKHGGPVSPRTSESTFEERPEPIHDFQEPVITAADIHGESTTNLSRPSTMDRETAEREFSRFDQGPLSDAPAAVPAASIQPSPEPDHHKFEVPTAGHLHPEATVAPESSMPLDQPVSDQESVYTMEEDYDPQVVKKHWMAIRDNMDRRVARNQERTSEDQSTQDRFSHSMQTDDGETSGEETIESRVARIKARVAELTGNMDHAAHV